MPIDMEDLQKKKNFNELLHYFITSNGR